MKTVKVKEIQTSPVIQLRENEMLSTAVKTILSKRIHNIVILNDDKRFSVLSVSDILNSVSRKQWAQTSISMVPKKALKLIDGEKSTIVASMAMEESDEIFGVIDVNAQLTGVVSYQDITDTTELSTEELFEISLNSIVFRNSASTADCAEKLIDVLSNINASPTACLIVLKEGKPCGIITQRDIVRLLDAGKSLDEPLEKYMTSPLFAVAGDISVPMALQLMQKHHYRRIIVLDDKGFLA
ncbi:MAG: CBS domain-containing protein, partial [Sulfuricurvum sp.]|nr:CBS domain-containing protein [Sulfuricurvum sp.]